MNCIYQFKLCSDWMLSKDIMFVTAPLVWVKLLYYVYVISENLFLVKCRIHCFRDCVMVKLCNNNVYLRTDLNCACMVVGIQHFILNKSHKVKNYKFYILYYFQNT